MRVVIEAHGARKAVTADVREQVRLLRATAHPESPALLSAVGDEVIRQVDAVTGETVHVHAAFVIEVGDKPRDAKPAAAFAPALKSAPRDAVVTGIPTATNT